MPPEEGAERRIDINVHGRGGGGGGMENDGRDLIIRV
jgi:hypothetical protein